MNAMPKLTDVGPKPGTDVKTLHDISVEIIVCADEDRPTERRVVALSKFLSDLIV